MTVANLCREAVGNKLVQPSSSGFRTPCFLLVNVHGVINIMNLNCNLIRDVFFLSVFIFFWDGFLQCVHFFLGWFLLG